MGRAPCSSAGGVPAEGTVSQPWHPWREVTHFPPVAPAPRSLGIS